MRSANPPYLPQIEFLGHKLYRSFNNVGFSPRHSLNQVAITKCLLAAQSSIYVLSSSLLAHNKPQVILYLAKNLEWDALKDTKATIGRVVNADQHSLEQIL
jgi:hypothetical protein